MGEERLNALSLVCIHRDILLDYDKIIDIYASSIIYAHFFNKENLIVLPSLLKD